VVQCFPGKREPKENDKPRDKSPIKATCNACSKWLQEDIYKGSYKRVIVFGNYAKEAVKRLGYRKDPRFKFFPHPTASGVSIVQLATTLDNAE
jgi:uracil-DNA glycosylase